MPKQLHPRAQPDQAGSLQPASGLPTKVPLGWQVRLARQGQTQNVSRKVVERNGALNKVKRSRAPIVPWAVHGKGPGVRHGTVKKKQSAKHSKVPEKGRSPVSGPKKQEVVDARAEAQAHRKEWKKKLLKKNQKGQPLMKHRVEQVLEKLAAL